MSTPVSTSELDQVGSQRKARALDPTVTLRPTSPEDFLELRWRRACQGMSARHEAEHGRLLDRIFEVRAHPRMKRRRKRIVLNKLRQRVIETSERHAEERLGFDRFWDTRLSPD